jgi:hypothetical protein
MVTDAQYTAAANAVLTIIKADIAKTVPAMFQSQIPQDMLVQFAADAAHAAVDAAEKAAS